MRPGIIGLSGSGGLCHTASRPSKKKPRLPIDTQLLHVGAALVYGIVLALLGRGLANERLALQSSGHVLLTLAIFLHAMAIWSTAATPSGFDLGLQHALNLMFLVMTIFVALCTVSLPVTILLIPLIPLDLVLLLWSGFAGHSPEAPGITMQSLPHVIISILAASVLLLAFLQALLLRAVERHLKSRTFTWAQHVPPLETLEKLLFAAIWTGLILLLIGIATGFVTLEDMFAQRVVHHTVLLSAAAVGYIVLLIGRYRFGWRGETAVHWVLISTSLLVLGYFGSKFVIEILLAPAS